MSDWSDRPLIVMKFGGSSVATPERLREVAFRIKKERERGYRVAAVVSAMGRTTDQLLSLAEDVGLGERGREVDQLLATGEQQSVALLALALVSLGVPAQSFTAAQAGFYAVGFPMEGRLSRLEPQAVEKVLNEGVVAVVVGFQAITDKGDIITLGRGGSDLSAVALAAALEAQSCRILKDVSGIFSGDPKIVERPKKLARLGYDECMEMAVCGAKVLQARSVEMAARYEVPLYVASSFDEEEEGSWVMKGPVSEGLVVKAVVQDTGVAKVSVLGVPDVPGIAARLFTDLASCGIGAEMIIQNGMRGGVNDITFLVKKKDLNEAIQICRQMGKDVSAQGVTFDTEIARVSVIGAGIANHPDVPSRMFSTLAAEDINIEMISSTSLAITCVVGAHRAEDAVRALHRHFIEEGEDVKK